MDPASFVQRSAPVTVLRTPTPCGSAAHRRDENRFLLGGLRPPKPSRGWGHGETGFPHSPAGRGDGETWFPRFYVSVHMSPGSAGKMVFEKFIRSAGLAVGLKPSATGCEARLRGLERMMYSKTILPAETRRWRDARAPRRVGYPRRFHPARTCVV